MHKHEIFDPGSLYGDDWVQTIIEQIQGFLQNNTDWVGVGSKQPQRVLDYACGNGTVSTALLDRRPQTIFQGIDSHPAQVERFNTIAKERLGDSTSQRMWAIAGDLSDPCDALQAENWFNFDVAIISMALHHVNDPTDMLRRLRQRLKPKGVLVVVEMTPESSGEDAAQQGYEGGDKTHPGNSYHTPYAHSTNEMVEVIGGQRIWAGFTLATLSAAMEEAGFVGIEGRMHAQTFTVPEGVGASGTKRLMFARGVSE